jgi:hypothetical protein
LNVYTNLSSIKPGSYQSRIPEVGTIKLNKESLLINDYGFGGIVICNWTETLDENCFGLVGD